MLRIMGHRGAKNEAPENTLAGFRHARAIGLEAVEFDVRLARDREIVVIHDDTVDRTTTSSGLVSDLTASELADLDARATFPDWPERVGVPTLGAVLDVVAPLPVFQIEIKSDTDERLEEIVAGVLALLRARSLERQAILTSFNPVALEAVRRLAPEQQRAYINGYEDADALDTALRLGCTQANFIRMTSSPPETEAMIGRAREAGLRIGGGTCNDAEALQRVRAWGADLIGSDVPTEMLRLQAGQ